MNRDAPEWEGLPDSGWVGFHGRSSPHMGEALKALREQGLQTITLGRPGKLLAAVVRRELDVVLLEVEGSMKEHITLLWKIRRLSPLPILSLSRDPSPESCTYALGAGADDWLRLEAPPTEIVLRVRLLLRRGRRWPWLRQPRTVIVPGVRIDLVSGEVHLGEQRRLLSELETDFLRQLAGARGAVVGHDSLIRVLWGEAGEQVSPLKALVHHVRAKVEPDPSQPRIVQSHRGLGYSLGCATFL